MKKLAKELFIYVNIMLIIKIVYILKLFINKLYRFYKSIKLYSTIMIGTNYVKGLNLVDPTPIHYSQDTVNLYEDHYKLEMEMEKNGWNNEYSLDVVLFKNNPQTLVSIDNRRLYLAKKTKLKTILVNVHLAKDTDI